MDRCDWIGLAGIAIALAGIAIGCGIAYWQWLDAKIKGDKLVWFLHGLKGNEHLPEQTIVQVNDMLARLEPPKK
jgi:hypothetical protein